MGSQLQAFITAVILCDLAWQGSGLAKILWVSDVWHSEPATESCCHTCVSLLSSLSNVEYCHHFQHVMFRGD